LVTLVMLCAVNAFNYVDRSMVALALPQMKADLALSDTMTGVIAGLPFALCYAACALPAAWFADRGNRRNLLSVAFAFWSAMTALTGLVRTGWELAAARFMLGAGEAAGHPTTASLIADTFPLRQRTVAFSALSASAYMGPLAGFPAVGWLIAHHGWRGAYAAVGLAGIAFAGVFFMVVREPGRNAHAQGPVRAGFGGAAGRLLAIPSYRLVVLSGGFNAINQGAHLTWAPTFLTRVHHLDPLQASAVFGVLRGLAGLAGALVVALGVAALVRRDLRWQIRAALVVAALPFLSDSLFLLAGDEWAWRTGLALSAFFTAMAVALSYPLYVNVAPPDLRATASAVYFLVVGLMGLTLGPFCVGALSDRLGSIAWAMVATSAAALVSCVLLALAARHWARDVQLAEA
jgi:MFS family permease